MTQAILIILAAYFWVFQREAMLCDSFPAPGTVFRVFSRTVCSKVLFVILTFTPAISQRHTCLVSALYSLRPIREHCPRLM